MRGVVTKPFVHPEKLIYLPVGVEIDVPEDRAAAFSRWMRFYEVKEAETADEKPKTKRARKAKA